MDRLNATIEAKGDPNCPDNAAALAATASRVFARVMTARTGRAWVAA